MKHAIKYAAATCVALSVLLAPVIAQQGITRTPLGAIDFPSGYQTVMGIAQVPANTCWERHTHPGVENYYILEGEDIMKMDSKPDLRRKARDSGQIPAGAAHTGCTTAALKVLTVHIVEKGKPLASPAP
jgi:mannose-6-phosphate isomerase-like protein (cupin superfamily)